MKYIRLFLTAGLLLVASSIWAHDFEVEGIFYQITSDIAPFEVGVTNNNGNGNSYSGHVVIPNHVYYNGIRYVVTSIIGDWVRGAFYNCTELVSVEIPNSITSIGRYAFYVCNSLTNISIPNSVESIEENAFGNCNGLASIVVAPDNPVYDSRENCNAIIKTATNTIVAGCKNTIIPNSVTSIGDYAFYCCDSLLSISFPNSIMSIGENAFEFCRSLTSINLPVFVQSIGGAAFKNCTGLSSISIPNSLESIGNCAFAFGNTGPTSIVVSSGNLVYDSRENCNAIIETATNTLITGCKNTIIPNSVTSIGSYAFSFCYGWFSIYIPNSVISIGEHAFRFSAVTNVTFPDSLISIGNDAFYHCAGLTSIDLPESLTSIGRNAFKGCTGLNEIIIKAIIPPVCGYDPFPNYFIPIYVPCGSKEAYFNADVWKDNPNIFGMDLLMNLTVCSADEALGRARISQQPDCDSHIATVIAEPIGDYFFLNWTVNGQVVSTANPYTFLVEGDMELVANFSGVGMEEEMRRKIILFPNPATDRVSVTCEGMKSLAMCTLEGKTAKLFNNLNADETEIDLADLTKGLYLLRIELQNGLIINKKIIIQ